MQTSALLSVRADKNADPVICPNGMKDSPVAHAAHAGESRGLLLVRDEAMDRRQRRRTQAKRAEYPPGPRLRFCHTSFVAK